MDTTTFHKRNCISFHGTIWLVKRGQENKLKTTVKSTLYKRLGFQIVATFDGYAVYSMFLPQVMRVKIKIQFSIFIGCIYLAAFRGAIEEGTAMSYLV